MKPEYLEARERNPYMGPMVILSPEAYAELSRLRVEVRELREAKRRLVAMMPLFEEARDALTAIPLANAKLHGLRLDLAERMDEVGVAENWKRTDAAMNEAPVEKEKQNTKDQQG